MPTTPEGFRYPASTDDVQLWTKFQALAEDVDTYVNLPDEVVSSLGAGIVTIASTINVYTSLPSPGPLTATITNPSSVYDLIVDVNMQCWMIINSAGSGNVQVGITAIGGVTFAAGTPTPGGAGAQSFGDNAFVTGANGSGSYSTTIPVVIPAGAAAVTFGVQASRSVADGVKTINYATLRVIPRRFRKP